VATSFPVLDPVTSLAMGSQTRQITFCDRYVGLHRSFR